MRLIYKSMNLGERLWLRSLKTRYFYQIDANYLHFLIEIYGKAFKYFSSREKIIFQSIF